MISCGDKKTYNNYRSSLQFTSKNKYFINTINTDYIKQGSKSKMSLMSPTSYQTAPSRDNSLQILLSLVNIKNQVLYINRYINFCNNIYSIMQFYILNILYIYVSIK